jgi:hypothetical protein
MGESDVGGSTANCFIKWTIPDQIARPTTKNADCSDDDHKADFTGFSEKCEQAEDTPGTRAEKDSLLEDVGKEVIIIDWTAVTDSTFY